MQRPEVIYAVEGGLTLALNVKDDAEWARTAPKIVQALAARDTIKRQLQAGTAKVPFYADVADAYRRSAAATDARARQLALLVAENQFTLDDYAVIDRGLLWAKGLPEKARFYLHNSVVTPGYCQAHIKAGVWLENDIATNGWPKISTSGVQMDQDAGMVVVDVPTALKFQHQVLDILTPLVASHDTSPQNFAELFDQVAYKDDRPQRYGTKIVCDINEPGAWSIYKTEDPSNLDARRAELGLEPEVQYTARVMGGDKRPC